MKSFAKKMLITTIASIALLASAAVSSASPAAGSVEDMAPVNSDDSVRSAVDFDHELDSYQPHKDRYNFYFTYKTVHSWWDAVALGMEEAQRQYLNKGITITYEYMAPEGASAEDQIQRLHEAQ